MSQQRVHFNVMFTFLIGPGELYTSEKTGSDENGDGTQDKPFKTVLEALRRAEKEPFPAIFVDGKTEGKVHYNLVLTSVVQGTIDLRNFQTWVYFSFSLIIFVFLQRCEPASASSMKKMVKLLKSEQKKSGEKAKKEAEDAEKRAKNLEDARKIVIQEDASLPAAQLSKICKLEALRGQRVKVFGWVHRLRRQGNFF